MRPRLVVMMLTAVAAAMVSLSSGQTQPSLPPEKVAVVLGQNIHYYEAGQGPAVILLHGLGANAGIWVSTVGPLSANHHVYALDQIGFGHSDKPLLDYKVVTFVDFLYGFMQSQKLSKATLMGNSLGGWVALEFAAQHPEMVDKLVLVDSAGLPFSQAPSISLNPSSLAEMRKVLEAVFYDKKIVTEEFVQLAYRAHLQNNDGYTIQRTLAGFSSPDQFETAKLAVIHAPTLIVWGRQDELTPLAMGEQLREGISGAKLAQFDQCGHIPQMEKPAEFNRAVLEFLGQ